MLLLNTVRERIRTIDPNQPLSRPITLEDVVGFETVQPRFNMALFTFFGLLGLALAAVGIYSMLSYSVARRTHEIGIRMALGANRNNVLSLMLAMGGKLVLIGLAVVWQAAWRWRSGCEAKSSKLPGRILSGLGGGGGPTSARRPCWHASRLARRASKLDPMAALRHE